MKEVIADIAHLADLATLGLADQSNNVLHMIEAYNTRQDGLKLRLTNKRLYDTQKHQTAEERYWMNPDVGVDYTDGLAYEEFFHDADEDEDDVIDAAHRWTLAHPDVEIVLSYTGADEKSHCYVCDVGGTMAGVVMAIVDVIDGGDSGFTFRDHTVSVWLRALFRFLDRSHPRRTRRSGVITTLRTQLYILPRDWNETLANDLAM